MHVHRIDYCISLAKGVISILVSPEDVDACPNHPVSLRLLSPLMIHVILLPLFCRKHQKTWENSFPWCITNVAAVPLDSYTQVIV